MACNPLIAIDSAGHYQAWCKPHGWYESPVRDFRYQAEADLAEHLDQHEQPEVPDWYRGPR